MQAEDFLHAGQRRKFFGRNLAQLRFGEAPAQCVDDCAPASLEQRQGIHRQRVEEAAADVGRPGFQVGEHPDRIAPAGRRDRDTEHVTQ